MKIDIRTCTRCGEIVYNSTDERLLIKIYSDDGYLIGRIAKERRTVIPFDSLPEHVIQAFLAAEDANFYKHQVIIHN